MSIGKSSITKRVAKSATEEQNIAPELVATVAAPKAETKKAPAKKTTATKKTTSTAKTTSTKKTTTAKKASSTKKATATAEKKVDTAVIANISPETVAAVIGHEETKGFEKVQLGDKMPVHLL